MGSSVVLPVSVKFDRQLRFRRRLPPAGVRNQGRTSNQQAPGYDTPFCMQRWT